MEATIQDNIQAFNNAFAAYLGWSRKQPQEALERKVKNIGFRLFKGFQAHEFGGVPRQAGIAKAQLQARTAEGLGTKVRPDLLAQYQEARGQLLAERRELRKKQRGGTLDDWSEAKAGLAKNSKARASLWQKIVGQEIRLRQEGIGYLGAAFLWYRNRGKGDSKRQVLNHTGKPIGSVTVQDGLAVILGQVAGLTIVDEKYGVVAQAINDETDDTLNWIKEQQDNANAALGSILFT